MSKRPVSAPPSVVDRFPPMRARPWRSIADFYDGIPQLRRMVALVDHIAAAPYAAKVHGTTSMQTLVVAQTTEIRQFQEIIRIDCTPTTFEVTVQDRGYRLEVAKDDPVLRSVAHADGVAAFEQLLRAKRWD